MKVCVAERYGEINRLIKGWDVLVHCPRRTSEGVCGINHHMHDEVVNMMMVSQRGGCRKSTLPPYNQTSMSNLVVALLVFSACFSG